MPLLPRPALQVALLLAALAPAVAAQTHLELSLALSCLSPPAELRGEPEYPEQAYKFGHKGRVKVAIEFPGGPFGGPRLKVLEHEGDDEFVTSVRRYLGKLEAPCLGANERAELVFEFVFNPELRKVTWADPTDADGERRKRMLGCIRHLQAPKQLEYPYRAQRRQVQGRVLARLRFEAPDAAPQVEVFHRPSAQDLADAVQPWAAQWRMPCLEGGPVTVTQLYTFVFDKDVYGFKPLTLPQLLGNIKGLSERGLKLDTTTMGCPFDLKLHYRRPMLTNVVGEVDRSEPSRRPLLELLTAAELDLRNAGLDAIYGDTADITVPCLRIDVKPKEKTS